jgi:hypothetical protein
MVCLSQVRPTIEKSALHWATMFPNENNPITKARIRNTVKNRWVSLKYSNLSLHLNYRDGVMANKWHFKTALISCIILILRYLHK